MAETGTAHTAILGTKATITFASGFCAEAISFNGQLMSRPVIDVTHLNSSDWREKLPGTFIQGGSLSVTVAYDCSTTPPILDAPDTVTITFANSNTWKFTGFLTACNITTPLEDRVTADLTISVVKPYVTP